LSFNTEQKVCEMTTQGYVHYETNNATGKGVSGKRMWLRGSQI